MLPPETLLHISQDLLIPRPPDPNSNAGPAYWRISKGADSGLPTLARLCRCSRAFNKLFTPLLYHTLLVDITASWHLDLLATLASHPELGSHILNLRVSRWADDEGKNESVRRKETHVPPKIVEALLKVAVNVEQINLTGLDTGVTYHEISRSRLRTKWTKVFLLLADCPRLRSLSILRDSVGFELPALPHLKSLAVDHDEFLSLAFSSPLPSLTMLAVPPRSYLDNRYPNVLEQLLPQLEHLSFNGRGGDPLLVAGILSRATKLKSFDCLLFLACDNFGYNLPTVLLNPVEAAIVDKLDIALHVDQDEMLDENLSEDFVEGVRKLLFDYRRCKYIRVQIIALDVEPEWKGDEVLPLVKRVWQREGTEVEITYEEKAKEVIRRRRRYD